MSLNFKISHKFIIVWISLSAFIHSLLMNGANNVIISSLQKEFYLSGQETGFYVSVYDIGSLFSSIFISFAAARGSKPRWIAFGMIMLFIGCMVNVLPHFLKPNETNLESGFETKQDYLNASHVVTGDNIIELCNYSMSLDDSENSKYFARNLTQETKLIDNRPKVPAMMGFQLKYLLYAASIISGLSSASITSITFSYIEDIAPNHKISSIYEVIYFVFASLGVS